MGSKMLARQHAGKCKVVSQVEKVSEEDKVG